MSGQIVQKAIQILEGLEQGHFETAKDWSPSTKDDFYLYFSDSDYETRKMALLVFAAAVGNTRRGVARVMHSDNVIIESKTSVYNDKSSYAYSFENYLNAFLMNKESIETEFPLLYKVILAELKLWHDKESFYTRFADVDKTLLDKVVELIKDTHVHNSDLNLDPALAEVQWPPSK
ncbi:hypothetical protein [Planococcus sp. NCCP-2050]|uniref:hypothetical protein n=1 Tax=Planococcus sp. NCCP-2050 TaxID=2944679 RepID=UPI00203A830D|nr:hypothetical protein [Planococcus sp. NCCP-2050]GKW46919.1 hypothetical protein NCCP2050_26110 [Planococcus sp. NCCP-2050]